MMMIIMIIIQLSYVGINSLISSATIIIVIIIILSLLRSYDTKTWRDLWDASCKLSGLRDSESVRG